MKTHLIAYAAALLSFVVIDAAWITLVMSRIFQHHLSHLMADSITWWPIVLFYSLFPLGVYVFVVKPALLHNQSLMTTFGFGVFLGLLAYSAYDLTNQATLKDWPPFVTVLDIAWGGFVTGITSVISVMTVRKFLVI